MPTGRSTGDDKAHPLHEGEWREGKFHGKGKARYPGGIYEGFYRNGERHGQGTLTDGWGV